MADWTTTLFAWVWTRWPRAAAVPQRPTTIFPMAQSTAHIPHEYRALYAYLEHRYASAVVLTFDQIEALLGFALPPPAGTEREWWTTVETHGHSVAWTGAGRTAAPRLAAGIVTFERPA